MQENNFEQDVQRSMGGLRIKPSAAVWEKLEAELRQRRRRRIFLLASLLGGLIILGSVGAFFFLDGSETGGRKELAVYPILNPETAEEKTKEAVDMPVSGNGTGTTIDQGTANTKTNSVAVSNRNSIDRSETPTASKQKSPITESPIDTKVGREQESRVSNTQAGEPLAVTKAKTENADIAKAKTVLTSDTKQEQKETAIASASTPSVTDSASQPASAPASNTSIPDSASQLASVPASNTSIPDSASQLVSVPASNTSIPDSASQLASAPEPIIIGTPFSKKPIWVIAVSGGMSTRANAAMEGDKPAIVPEYLQGAAFPNAWGNFAGLASPVLPPSEVRPGFAFQISAGLQKAISKKGSVYVGLSYQQLSDRIKVGDYRVSANFAAGSASMINQSVRAYSGIPHKNFTNRYHLIGLPVRYQWHFLQRSGYGISWHAGLAPGYQLTENALVYTSAQGGSYKRDRQAYKRFRMQAGTGFDLLLNKGGKINWSIGPELMLSLNKLIPDARDSKQYLYYGGLSGKIYFNR